MIKRKKVFPMSDITEFLAPQDPAVAEAIAHELQRQRDKIELIASENFASRAVMAAQGSLPDKQIC